VSRDLLETTGNDICALPVELLREEAGELLLVDEKILNACTGEDPGGRRPG